MDILEDYCNTFAVVPPLSQFYRNIHVAYCNIHIIAIVKISQ